MKFGVREICDVVLKAKATQMVGNKKFYRGEPVLYFDTLKTSSMEGEATTVYAQGGRGNARLMSWDGERTVTFTMEDALISPEGFMILSGAGLIESDGANTTVKQHITEQLPFDGTTVKLTEDTQLEITLSNEPYLPTAHAAENIRGWAENYIYVMLVKNGEIVSEPFIPNQADVASKKLTIKAATYPAAAMEPEAMYSLVNDPVGKKNFPEFDSVIVDYYVERKAAGAGRQIEITPDKFGGNYYLEASTLFRDTNGVDYPAEFVIPNCKVQSKFTFTMASSGDPSTFTFTRDAFPDYTKFDKTKKVLAAIQIIDSEKETGGVRTSTYHTDADAAAAAALKARAISALK